MTTNCLYKNTITQFCVLFYVINLVSRVCTCILSCFCLLLSEEPNNEAMLELTSVITEEEVFDTTEKQQNPKNEDSKNEDTKIENSQNEASEETHTGLPHQSQMVRPDPNVLPPQLSKSVTRQAADSTSHGDISHR